MEHENDHLDEKFRHNHEKLGHLLYCAGMVHEAHAEDARRLITKAIAHLGSALTTEWEADCAPPMQEALEALAGALSHFALVEEALKDLADYYEGHLLPSDESVKAARSKLAKSMSEAGVSDDEIRRTLADLSARAESAVAS
jgi:hypothetical protein